MSKFPIFFRVSTFNPYRFLEGFFEASTFFRPWARRQVAGPGVPKGMCLILFFWRLEIAARMTCSFSPLKSVFFFGFFEGNLLKVAWILLWSWASFWLFPMEPLKIWHEIFLGEVSQWWRSPNGLDQEDEKKKVDEEESGKIFGNSGWLPQKSSHTSPPLETYKWNWGWVKAVYYRSFNAEREMEKKEATKHIIKSNWKYNSISRIVLVV